MNSSATPTRHTVLIPSKQTPSYNNHSHTLLSPTSTNNVHIPTTPLSDVDSTPYTSTSLALQQLSHWLVSMQQLSHTFSNLQQRTPNTFTQQINKLFTQTNDQFRAFILAEYRTPSSPLHDHWNLLSSQRSFVWNVARDKCTQMQQQIQGLNQIKLCLTAQLSKLVSELKQQVDSVKGVDSPNVRSTITPSGKVLPIAVQQLHGKCMAIHKDIQVLDTELTNSTNQLSDLQSWLNEQEGGSTEEEIQKRQEKEQRMKQELQQSKLAASPASPSMQYSRHSTASSRFSTPGSHNIRQYPATPSSAASEASSSISTTSSSSAISERSSSNFSASNGSTPLSPREQENERQHDMQPLLFSPIMPHSNLHSPDSGISTPSVAANQHTLFTPTNDSPSEASGVSVRGHQPSMDLSSLDMLFEKIWSGSPSQRALEQSNTPVKPMAQRENSLTPSASAPFSIIITPANEVLQQAAVSHVDEIPVEQPQTSSEYYLQRAKEIAAQMNSSPSSQHSPQQPQQESSSPLTSVSSSLASSASINPITPSSLISMSATSPFEQKLTPIQFQSPPSASKHLALLNGMHMTPQQLAELDAPFGSNSPSLKPKSPQQQTNELSPQKISPLAQLQQLQRAKAQRHAWMKQMAKENADESNLYDEDDDDENDSDTSMCSSNSSLNESSASTAPILNDFLNASPVAPRSMSSTPVKSTPTRPSLQSLLQRMTPQRNTPASTKKHKQPESPQQQEIVAAAEPVSTTASSRGWSASFSMGSNNQQFRALVSNLQSIASSTFDSPTPAPPASFQLLSRSTAATTTMKDALILSPATSTTVNFTSPHRASTMQLLKKVQSLNRHSQEELSSQQQHQHHPTVLSPVSTNTSRTREWFDIDAEVLAPSPDAGNESASYSEWNKENSSPEDESASAVFSESEEDANDVSTVSSTSSIPASPLRYSVFRPTVVIKKVTKDESAMNEESTDEPAKAAKEAEEVPITSRRKQVPKASLRSASKPAPVVVPTRASLLLAAKAASANNKSNHHHALKTAKTQSQKKKTATLQTNTVSSVPIILPMSMQMQQ